MEKISAILIVYNEEKLIERALKSIEGVVDEILIAHDGPCTDKTIEICKKYTKNIFIMPHKGRSAFHWIPLIRKVKHDWILKLDADEYLSEELKDNIRLLANNKNNVAYSFKWLWYDEKNKKYFTKDWPRKTSLYRKSKISGIGFPAWDNPIVNGETIETPYSLEHRPINKPVNSWQGFWDVAIKRYCKGQAKYTLVDFNTLDKYNYDATDFPWKFRLRRRLPILTAPVFSFLSFFIILKKLNVFKEGKIVFNEAVKTSIYYLFLGYYISKLKKGKDIE